MDLKNMEVSIGIVIAIVAQAFGIIWYVAQLDSTVSNLDASVSVMQESQASVDLAVLQTQVDSLTTNVKEISHREEVDLSDIEQAITELETALKLIKENLDEEKDTRHNTLDDMLDRLGSLELTQGIIENEMRTIMGDHEGFNDALKELGLSGYSDKRQYGNYGGQ